MLDPSALDDLRRLGRPGRESALVRFARHFLATLPADAARLEGALEAGDWDEMDRVAHGLKSVAATFGGRDLSDLCARVCECAQNHDVLGARAARARLPELCARTRRAVEVVVDEEGRKHE